MHIVQGQYHVTNDPDIVLATILGSCVAACLRDPLARVGGMNHFLLTDDSGCDRGGDAMRFGVHAMELLINGLFQHGARRERLEAKLFGGARMLDGLTDVGAQNSDFAERFLSQERIALTGGSLRGEQGRRIQFWPVSGRARQLMLKPNEAGTFTSERRPTGAPSVSGSVELF